MGTPKFGDPGPHIPSDMGKVGNPYHYIGICSTWVPKTLETGGIMPFGDLGTPKLDNMHE